LNGYWEFIFINTGENEKRNPRRIDIQNQKRLLRFMGQPLLEKEKDENHLFLYVS